MKATIGNRIGFGAIGITRNGDLLGTIGAEIGDLCSSVRYGWVLLEPRQCGGVPVGKVSGVFPPNNKKIPRHLALAYGGRGQRTRFGHSRVNGQSRNFVLGGIHGRCFVSPGRAHLRASKDETEKNPSNFHNSSLRRWVVVSFIPATMISAW